MPIHDPVKRREWQRQWRLKHPGYWKKFKSKRPAQMRKTRYGVTQEDFDALLARQGGKCPGCQKPITRANVDHDHATGQVRGIMCKKCNIALGYACDNPVILRNLAAYLEAI